MNYEELVKALRETATFTKFDDLLSKREQKLESLAFDAAAAIEALQAEVERLKDCNEELREKQTYIDHYGDKWMTSAKDVPTAAYKHGYADGRDEAEAQLPKRGEWVDGDARRVTARCSVCGLLRLGNGAEWANKHVHFCEVCGSRMGDEKA